MTDRLLTVLIIVNVIVGIGVGVFQYLQLRTLRQIRDRK